MSRLIPTPSLPSLTLTLLPVLTSTASVTFCLTEYWTLLPFLSPRIPPSSLAQFWDSYLLYTIPGWVGFYSSAAISGALVWRGSSVGSGMRTLYGWGSVLSVGHYVFGPTVAKLIAKIVHGPEDEAKGHLRTWLKVHTVRMLMVDIPAMLCFAGGFLHAV